MLSSKTIYFASQKFFFISLHKNAKKRRFCFKNQRFPLLFFRAAV